MEWTHEQYAASAAATAHRILAASEEIRRGHDVEEAVQEIHGHASELHHLTPPHVLESRS